MIQVTLTFDDQQSMLAYFQTLGRPAEAAVALAPKPTGRIKPEIRDESAAPIVEAPAPAATSPASSAASPSEAPALPDRQAVSQAIVKLAVKDKARTIAILASFGAKAGKELKDEHLAECLAQVNAALAA